MWWPQGNCAASCCTIGSGPGLCERPHVFETARAEALDPGKLRLPILGQAIDDLSPPPFRVLPDEDIPAHRPIQEDKFPVDGKGGPDLSTADAGFELLQEFPVAGGQLKGIFHCRQHSQDIAPDKNHCRW
jgi:hypothetical protein